MSSRIKIAIKTGPIYRTLGQLVSNPFLMGEHWPWKRWNNSPKVTRALCDKSRIRTPSVDSNDHTFALRCAAHHGTRHHPPTPRPQAMTCKDMSSASFPSVQQHITEHRLCHLVLLVIYYHVNKPARVLQKPQRWGNCYHPRSSSRSKDMSTSEHVV